MITEREKLGLRIEAERKKRGLNQAELGRFVGLDAPMISRIENGGRDITALEFWGVVQALGVSPEDILRGINIQGLRKGITMSDQNNPLNAPGALHPTGKSIEDIQAEIRARENGPDQGGGDGDSFRRKLGEITTAPDGPDRNALIDALIADLRGLRSQ